MKPTLTAATCLLLLVGCIPERFSHQTEAPSAPQIPLPSAAALTQEQHTAAPDYRPLKTDNVYYFDAGGRPAQQPQTTGYYRKILGKQANGKLWVQDFYQNNQKPYTSAYSLNNINEAENTPLFSRPLYFYPDGSLYLAARKTANRSKNETWFFHNNQAVAQIRQDTPTDTSETRLFHPNGKTAAIIRTHGSEQHILLFYPHGRAMLQIDSTPAQSSRLAWTAEGQTTLPADIAPEIRRQLAVLQNRLQPLHPEHSPSKQILADIQI